MAVYLPSTPEASPWYIYSYYMHLDRWSGREYGTLVRLTDLQLLWFYWATGELFQFGFIMPPHAILSAGRYITPDRYIYVMPRELSIICFQLHISWPVIELFQYAFCKLQLTPNTLTMFAPWIKLGLVWQKFQEPLTSDYCAYSF